MRAYTHLCPYLDPGGSAVHSRLMRKPMRCRLGMHAWRKLYNEQGQMYRTCQRCGQDDDPGGRITAVGGF